MWQAFDQPVMATDSEKNTSKVVVQTYLPEYQREKWDAHADELGMSRSEFVKSMVQAGRRGFDGAPAPETDSVASVQPTPEAEPESTEQAGPAADALEETIIEALGDAEYLSWDELLAAVTNDIETQLEETLQTLQSEDTVRYSGRHGGYTLDS